MEWKKFNSPTILILSDINLNQLKNKLIAFLLCLILVQGCGVKENNLRESEFSSFTNYKIKSENLIVESSEYNIEGLTSLAIIYPKGICDVCDKDIFKALKKHQNSIFYNDLIILVPLENYRDLIMYNKEYDLRFNNIIPYTKSILSNEVFLQRATFVELVESSVTKMYIPNKPIDSNKLDSFFSEYNSK